MTCHGTAYRAMTCRADMGFAVMPCLNRLQIKLHSVYGELSLSHVLGPYCLHPFLSDAPFTNMSL